MFKKLITIVLLLNAVGLQAQKQNPRGIYHMVSITGKNGKEKAMFDQYKICTDSMTWMMNITEDGRVDEQRWERLNRPYFTIGDNDHKVFNYTGEQPDATDPKKTRIYDSSKKGFTMKWWSTSQNHRVFPYNDWCTEQYLSNDFSASGEKIFDMLYSTKNKAPKGSIQGRWKVVGAIKMLGSKFVDEWQRQGKVELNENDYVPYQDKYAIIDDQYIFTAYREALLNQQPPSIYGYLQEYQVSEENGRTVTVQLLTNDNMRPMKYVFHIISDDKMIVKEEYGLFDYRSRELSQYVYAIWERTTDATPVIQQLTAASPFKDTKIIEPRGLYRYVAGGDPCRIREVRDSTFNEVSRNIKWYSTETYRLCTDTMMWQIEIRGVEPDVFHGIRFGEDNYPDYQPNKSLFITGLFPTSDYRHVPDVATQDKWVLFGCSETGFCERQQDGIWTFDKRGVTPLGQEVLDVLDGKIPYDAAHPLYGTWKVEGQVLNPTEAKIDSIKKGLCSDYVRPHIINAQSFYALTPQHLYTLASVGIPIIDKSDSDGKAYFVTLEKVRIEGKNTIVDIKWAVSWIDENTILACRNKQELVPHLPKCFVMKRKVGGLSLVNVVNINRVIVHAN